MVLKPDLVRLFIRPNREWALSRLRWQFGKRFCAGLIVRSTYARQVECVRAGCGI
jgi:hypothetical protein